MKRIWIGRVVSALPVAILLLSGVLKLLEGQEVVDNFTHRFGFAQSMIRPIGVLELFCTALYLIPRTAVFGAILLSGYFGGAVATELRVGGASCLLPLVFAILAWLGLWLREDRLRALVPLR